MLSRCLNPVNVSEAHRIYRRVPVLITRLLTKGLTQGIFKGGVNFGQSKHCQSARICHAGVDIPLTLTVSVQWGLSWSGPEVYMWTGGCVSVTSGCRRSCTVRVTLICIDVVSSNSKRPKSITVCIKTYPVYIYLIFTSIFVYLSTFTILIPR